MLKLTDYLQREVIRSSKYVWAKSLYIYFFRHGPQQCLLIYRLGKCIHDQGFPTIAKYFFMKLQKNYGVYIHAKAEIDVGLSIPHPTAIVIGQGVRVGKNAVIYQNTTIGGARKGDWKSNHYPAIGENLILFSGAVVIGNVRIGNNCIIAANAVVNKNIANNTTVAGVPAETIKVVNQ